jgi:uncharacterized protein YcfJ
MISGLKGFKVSNNQGFEVLTFLGILVSGYRGFKISRNEVFEA